MNTSNLPKVDLVIAPPEPTPGLRTRVISRPFKQTIRYCLDQGWLGNAPLDTHVIVSGFPRGGTTLLQAMLEVCIPCARIYGKEVRGITAAKYDINVAKFKYLVTKRPDDIFIFDTIREIYAKRKPSPKFILLSRDPRAVLTSRHRKNGSRPYVTAERWRWFFKYWQIERHSGDVLAIRYEDLVNNSKKVQQSIENHIGVQFRCDISDYHKYIDNTFDSTALNGIRPLDSQTITRWKKTEYKAELEQLMHTVDELPSALDEMGYGKSDS